MKVYLLCLGDIALAGERLLQGVWALPAELTPGEEVRILFNWELPLGDTINAVPRSSGPRLLAREHSLLTLKEWSPGFATLATNHILDAGEEGLRKTKAALGQAGFASVGAGCTCEEITSPLFWETAEGRLAIVNWVFPETHPDWMAIPGPNCWPGPEQARCTIQELKSRTDWVLVIVHWSDEHFPFPRPEDRAVASEMVQMGADFIVGHHPHVVRGMEVIDACPIFYSIGNYYFSDMKAPRHREGLGVQISLRQGRRPEYRIRSFWQTKGQVHPDKLCRAERRMAQASRPFARLEEFRYAEWYARKRARFDKWGSRWHFGVRRLGLRGTVRRSLQLLSARLRGDV